MRSRRGEAATPSHGASRSKVYDKTSILGVHLGRSNVQLYGSHGKTPAKNVIRRRCCQLYASPPPVRDADKPAGSGAPRAHLGTRRHRLRPTTSSSSVFSTASDDCFTGTGSCEEEEEVRPGLRAGAEER
ncbi:hypothetical protein MTO96_000029 [Rhipicephalus appendiculatus]